MQQAARSLSTGAVFGRSEGHLKAIAHGRAYGIARRELDVNVVEIYELPPGQ